MKWENATIKTFDDFIQKLLERSNVWFLNYSYCREASNFLTMTGVRHELCTSGNWIKTLGDESNRTLSNQDNEESEPMGKNQQTQETSRFSKQYQRTSRSDDADRICSYIDGY